MCKNRFGVFLNFMNKININEAPSTFLVGSPTCLGLYLVSFSFYQLGLNLLSNEVLKLPLNLAIKGTPEC